MSVRKIHCLSKLLRNPRRTGQEPSKSKPAGSGPGSGPVRRGRRPALEVLEGRSLPSTIIVNSAADTNPAVRSAAGILTLREAILLADGDPSLPYNSLTPAEKRQLTGPPSATTPNTILFQIGDGP
jgi:hypothetical protein